MNAQSIRELLQRFRGVRILVVGDVMVDEYVTGDCTRLSPEAPIPVLRVRQTRSVPGGAANTAANVAALGGQVVLVGAVGRDDAGRRIREMVAQRGVVDATVSDHRPTPRKVRAQGGQQQLLRLDYEDDGPATAAVADAAIAQIKAHLADVGVLVVSDYAKGLISPPFLQEVIRLARERRVPVVVDPRPQHGDCYAGCDYLTPNWKEAQALLGDLDGPASAERVSDVGRRLAQRFDANVLLTLGPHGLSYFGRDGVQLFDEPARTRAVFDVSGAGDTVVAAFALSCAAGMDVQTSLRLANRAAGVVVGKIGTAVVTPAELLAEFDGGDQLMDTETLISQVDVLRAAGRRIVHVTGVFEAIDPSNLDLLEDARRRGDVVVVGLHPGTIAAADRARVLLGLRYVDFVHELDNPQWIVEALQPAEQFEEPLAAPPGRAGQ